MSDTTFLWKYYFVKFITPDHPCVYQYVMGGPKSKETAVMRVTEIMYQWCSPYWIGDDTFNIVFIRGVARQYLKFMKEEWKSGKIKVKEIY